MLTTERSALILSTLMALLVGSAGVTFAVISNSQAILLDGVFNLIYFAIALVTVRVARLVELPDSDKYPYGYAYFESLVNAGKGLLILGVSLLALGDSLLALADGGRTVSAGPAIAYAAFATVAATITALLIRRAHRHSPGPLVRADLENWIINSLISGAVFLAFCLIPVLQWVGLSHLAPFVDPLLVTAVVLFCLGVPVRMASQSIKELLNRAPPRRIREPVNQVVSEILSQWQIRENHVRMVRPGRTLYAAVYVVLPAEFQLQNVAELDRIRAVLDKQIRRVHPRLVLDVIFTGDRRWALPTNGEESLPGRH